MKPAGLPRLYNIEKMAEMTAGNTAFIKKMARLFINQAPLDLAEMEKALTENNIAVLRGIAHRMKPAIDHFSILTLKSLVREIEQWDVNGIVTGKAATLDLFCRTVNTVIQQLTEDLEID